MVYEPGELKAVGYKNGQQAAEDVVKTTGNPRGIRLSAYKDEVNAGDTAIINVDIVDENGNIVPIANNEIRFEIDGAGTLTGTGNGNPDDHDSEKAPIRRAFNGKCQFLIKAHAVGEIEIAASSEKLHGAVCRIIAK